MAGEPLVTVENLKKYFPVRRGIIASLISRTRLWIKAVDGIDFEIRRGEILALAGESGCGKTTTARTLIRLEEPTEGAIRFDGEDITHLSGDELRPYRKRMQIIFQDPYESLNPRMNVYQTLAEPLRINKLGFSKSEERKRIEEVLELLKLIPVRDFIYRYPHELSGGQRQRVAIARAMILNPEFLVADEPVSMLDVSIRASILNELLELRKKFNLSILFITHDLAVASYVADRIAIMYLGKIVEIGPAEEVIKFPKHPYTQALISAVPRPEPGRKKRIPLHGEPPSPISIPAGCRFHPRCPYAQSICQEKEPPLYEAGNVKVSCHFWEEVSREYSKYVAG